MDVLGYAIGALAVVALAYVIGYRHAEDRAIRTYGRRVSGLEGEIKRQALELARLNEVTLQWVTVEQVPLPQSSKGSP